MNGRIVSDVDPNNWPKILALFMAEPTISRADKNRLEAEAINFTSSAPLTLQAMYDEMAAMVYLKMGRPSYKVSMALRQIGLSLVPDSNYLEYTFETNEEKCITVRSCPPHTACQTLQVAAGPDLMPTSAWSQ